jgi:putative tryptophan/tyrosine transport system substrate-binding protein
MRRRDFIAGLGAAAWPLAAPAQRSELPLVGFISGASPSPGYAAAFRKRLGEMGYAEGQNVTVEYTIV